MKQTINALTIAAASCLLLGGTLQAQSIVDQRVTTDRQIVEEPGMLTERTSTRTEIEQPDVRRGWVVSGETLAGRREIKSRDALIAPEGNGRAVIQDERGTRDVRVRGWLNPGTAEQ
jgi:hypothetical protein